MPTHDDQLEKRNVSKLTFGRVELVELNIVESGLTDPIPLEFVHIVFYLEMQKSV